MFNAEAINSLIKLINKSIYSKTSEYDYFVMEAMHVVGYERPARIYSVNRYK